MADAISAKDARELIASREVLVVDVRPRDELIDNPERVPGSLHIPADEIESRLDELPEDQRLLIASADGSGTAEVAEMLEQKGRDVARLEEGTSGWGGGERLTQPSPDVALPDPSDQPHETPSDDADSDEEGAEGASEDDPREDQDADRSG